MTPGARHGEEFRDDLRPLGAQTSGTSTGTGTGASMAQAGSGNAAARRWLTAEELAPLTQLSDVRSAAAVLQTLVLIALAIGFGLVMWPSPWVLISVLVIGVQQHALFILAHEAAHYRLFADRGVNDAVGRIVGMAGGISMCTYRVIHRLHHNNLYTDDDPDTAIHGGYPRGVVYLWKKLAQDAVGWNAWKTFAYFFGAPALNEQTQRASRPLDDTSAPLRAAARADRWFVAALQIALPTACAAVGGWTGLAHYAVLWLLPMFTVLQPILRLRAICEHGGVTDFASPLTAARSNRTWGSAGNLLARALLFPHHVNHHLEHHLYPAVPHYHLRPLHALLVAKGALDGAEVRDVHETLALVFASRRPRRSLEHQIS